MSLYGLEKDMAHASREWKKALGAFNDAKKLGDERRIQAAWHAYRKAWDIYEAAGTALEDAVNAEAQK